MKKWKWTACPHANVPERRMGNRIYFEWPEKSVALKKDLALGSAH